MKSENFLMKLAAFLIFMNAALPAFSQNFFWYINGNRGTNPAYQYLGTRDNRDFVIRTNALPRIITKANGDIGIGLNNPLQKLDVAGNINIGAGQGLYLGNQRFLSTPGNQNFYFGYQAGENSFGHDNTMIGTQSGQNGGGFHNTLIGYQAGMNNYGANNTFCGYQSGVANTYGTYNTFFGLATGYLNTTGDGNSLFGQNVLGSNVSGSWNCAFGYESGNQTTNSYNCFFGRTAGFANVTGSGNTFVGTLADANGSDYYNSSCLGYTSQLTASNQVRLGNSSVTSIGGFTDWSNISDGRFKKNVQDNVPGLEFIKQLKPVTYRLDVQGINKILYTKNVANKEDNNFKTTSASEKMIAEKEKIIYSGFIAQDVEAAAKKMGYNFSGIDAPKNENDLYGLRYAQFVMPVVKAIQELALENETLKTQVATMQDQINQLMLKNGNTYSGNLNNARLEQNNPNPFNNVSLINYYIPGNTVKPVITIYSSNGSLIKTFNIAGSGAGQIKIQKAALAAGVYYYTLSAGNKTIDTKQMILTK